mmetsp:Transcript_146789/g.270973  ORF Transcript_146789/g.270973 Transcript_146789/m.270973 type:complete len:176 (+) Transcript_146789:84-611(+)
MRALVLGLVLSGSYLAVADITWDGINAKIAKDFPKVPHLSVEELAVNITQRPVNLIDVRSPAEFLVSHLKGAVNLERAQDIASEYPDKSAALILYCSVGYRSARESGRLMKMGYQHVWNVKGSIFEWANKGRPVYHNGHRVHFVHPFDEKWGVLLHPELHKWKWSNSFLASNLKM